MLRAGGIVAATIEVYNSISAELLPTPAKFHYTFNLRDISKVFQGMLMISPVKCKVSDSAQKMNLNLILLRRSVPRRTKILYQNYGSTRRSGSSTTA